MALPLLNLLAVTGLAWLGVVLATHYGRSPWWGFVLPIAVNVGISLLRDLTDPLAALAVCGLLTAWLLALATVDAGGLGVGGPAEPRTECGGGGAGGPDRVLRRDWPRTAVTTAVGLVWVAGWWPCDKFTGPGRSAPKTWRCRWRR